MRKTMPALAAPSVRGLIMASTAPMIGAGGPTPRALRAGAEMSQRMREAVAAEGPQGMAILARINAAASGAGGDAPNAAALERIEAAVDKMREEQAARIDAIEAALDGTISNSETQRMAALLGGGSGVAADAGYSKAFASYTRRGATDAEATLKTANAEGERATIQASFTEGDASTGGYLAPVEWDRQIQKAQRTLSPMRRLSQVVTTGRAAYSTLWTNDQWGSGWVGETASRPLTSTSTFAPLVIPAGEIYAMPAVTQRLLDDSAINLEEWMAQSLSDEFSRQEGIAFVSGDGVNKPMGLLQYVPGGLAETGPQAHPGGVMSITKSGSASTIGNTDVLVDLKYGLLAPYRQNASWLMNSQTAAVIAKLKDGQGNYIWREALLASEPATLLGRPVEIDENMPNIAAGAYPIAFGDFARGYLVNDRVGVRILRDPYSNKPFIMLYSTKRVGGGLLDPRAIRLMQISA